MRTGSCNRANPGLQGDRDPSHGPWAKARGRSTSLLPFAHSGVGYFIQGSGLIWSSWAVGTVPQPSPEPLAQGQVEELMSETRAKRSMPAHTISICLSLLPCEETTDCCIPPIFKMQVKHILSLETGTNFFCWSPSLTWQPWPLSII